MLAVPADEAVVRGACTECARWTPHSSLKCQKFVWSYDSTRWSCSSCGCNFDSHLPERMTSASHLGNNPYVMCNTPGCQCLGFEPTRKTCQCGHYIGKHQLLFEKTGGSSAAGTSTDTSTSWPHHHSSTTSASTTGAILYPAFSAAKDLIEFDENRGRNRAVMIVVVPHGSTAGSSAGAVTPAHFSNDPLGSNLPASSSAVGDNERWRNQQQTVLPSSSPNAGSTAYPASLGRKRQPGVRGLANYANTCYLNSVLQCLSNVDEFREEMLKYAQKHDLMTKPMVGAFVKLLKTLWKDESSSQQWPESSSIKRLLEKADESFAGYQQQDALETMTMLLDCLHNEMNNGDKSKYVPITEKRLDELANAQWKFHTERNRSLVIVFFHGLMVKATGCQNCRKESDVTFSAEPFSFIVLSPPDAAAMPRDEADRTKTIAALMDSYFQQRPVQGSTCPNHSGCPLFASQKMWTAPKYLVVYLRRFTQIAPGQMRKTITDLYTYDERIDIRKYLQIQGDSVMCKLIAVICHQGTMNHGHYYCHAYNSEVKDWFTFNDSTTHEAGQSFKNDKNACIFVYKREN